MRQRRKGFTLVEIMIVVAIIGLLAAIAIPSFLKARETAQKNACINNLRQLDSAKNQWAIETGQQSSATPTWDNCAPYIKDGVAKMFCPADTTKSSTNSYTIGSMTNNPVCKIDATNHVL